MRWLRRFDRWQKLVLIAAGIIVVLLGIAGAILAIRWPFTETEVLQSIQESWPGTVHADRVHSIYLPHPGCRIENLILALPSPRAQEPTLVTIRSAQIRASYIDLFLRPGYLAHLLIEGLRIEVPVFESSESSNDYAAPSHPPTTSFGEVETHDALLIIKRSHEKSPLTFTVHRLVVRSIRRDAPMRFDGALSNAEPPGEILVHGQFGPWNSKKLKDIALSGSYTFERADLGVFHGIAGKLSSTGSFAGTMERVGAQGAIEIPSFQVTRAGHDVDLTANFRAVVDATKGNVALKNVDASFLHTAVHAEGTIAPRDRTPGKTASLDLSVRHGQINDVLKLFVQSNTPPMKGMTDFQTHIVVPPGQKPFLKKIVMSGAFSIKGAVLTNAERQNQVDLLSKRASGHKNETQTEQVSGQLDGKLALENGIAVFTPVSFAVPGASIHMTGRYDLFSETIDLHGDAKTQAKLSGDVTGIKSVLLKPLNSLFKKNGAGADVPVQMTGTYDNPHFGVELPVKK